MNPVPGVAASTMLRSLISSKEGELSELKERRQAILEVQFETETLANVAKA